MPPTQSPTTVVELAVNLDDVTAQVLGDAQERLLEAGALDVWTVGIGMKKQRPGVMLCVLAAESERGRLARMIIDLTGSLGVRYRTWERVVLSRGHASLTTRFGEVRLKLGMLDGALLVAQPEFEDVRAIAEATGVPVRIILQAAHAAADAYRNNLPHARAERVEQAGAEAKPGVAGIPGAGAGTGIPGTGTVAGAGIPGAEEAKKP